MIIGHGVDIIYLSRLDRIFLQNSSVEKFAKRICSKDEFFLFSEKFSGDYIKSKNFLAKKFSAKESISKAIGCGIGEFLSFKDIDIKHNSFGKPYVIINDAIVNAVNKVNNLKSNQDNLFFHLSTSDDSATIFTSAILNFTF